MKELFGCLCQKDFCLAILLLFPSLAECRHLLSVIELGGLYYYDSSDLIVNKTFQEWWRLLLFLFWQDIVILNKKNCHLKKYITFLTQLEFRGAGQGMGGQWSAAAQVDLGKTFSLFRNKMF